MMKRKMIVKSLLLACSLHVVSACSHQQVAVQTIFSSNDCAIKEPTLKSINTSVELKELFQSMSAKLFQSAITVPEVNHKKQSLVLYAVGQKPSSGYTIELYSNEAVIKKQTLYLPVRLKSPQKGSLQAQVLTSPCQLYALPKVDFSKIVIGTP